MSAIRPATPDDCETIANLIRELAIYEKMENDAKATPEDVRKYLFGDRPYAECVIAEVEGETVGFALFFFNFSTFRGRPGIYLEDLFVRSKFRGRGLGKALLVRLAKLAIERGFDCFEWVVLDWNEPSIGFYKALGAKPLDEWTVFRVDGDALTKLATMDTTQS